MTRAATLALALVGCADTLDDRLADLDDQTKVDCGDINDCTSQEEAARVVGCLQDNVAAGIKAKAFFILGLEEVAYVYAVNGSFLSIQGYYDEGDHFTEYRCFDFQIDPGTCATVHAIGCSEVRSWGQ